MDGNRADVAWVDDWPQCVEPLCENLICQWAGTDKCHPHSVEEVGVREMERRYAETRAGDGSKAFDYLEEP